MPSFSKETLSEACLRLDDRADQALRRASSFISEVDTKFAARFEDIQSLDSISGRLAATQDRIDRSLDLELVRARVPELTRRVEERLRSTPPTAQARLTHGQPHTVNILSDDQGHICVVDFGETIGYRSPLADLFLLLASHDGWSRGSGSPRQRQLILRGYGSLEDRDWSELRYWELRHWVLALQSYVSFSEDPSNDAQFVSNQLRFIRSQITEVTSGVGLISRIQSEVAAWT